MISLIAHLSIDIFIFGFLYDLITDRTNRNMNLLVEKPEISKKYNKFVLLKYNTYLLQQYEWMSGWNVKYERTKDMSHP